MRASVIIDNFNYAEFLGEAIDSALAQTYSQTEVIVVDDGSTDHSREVIARYGDSIIPILKENGGQGSALNTGFLASHGEFVIFLDADDVLLPGAVETLVPHFRNRDVAKAHWSMPIIDGIGKPTGEVMEPDLVGGDFRDEVRRQGPQSQATPLSAPTSGNAFARWFLEQVLPMPEDANRYGADTYLFALAPAYGRLVLLEDAQSLYRIHGENLHAGKSFAEILALARADLEILPAIAARPFQEAGVQVDLEQWRRHSWWARVDDAVATIRRLVGKGEPFVLVDEDSWGTDRDFFSRRRIQFPEIEGEYGGVPEDESAAIAALESTRLDGAVAIFFAWPAHWWLEHFEQLRAHLEGRYRCICRTELLIGFDLRE
jgi:glycosyltransferase involved in cell wall biosynthesis